MSTGDHHHHGRRPPFRRRSAPGAAPGTLVADPAAPPPCMQVIAYGPDAYLEQDLKEFDGLSTLLEQYPVVWVNIDGLGDASAVETIGCIFGLHPLALEDVLNSHQRSKVEQYGQYLFIIARMLNRRAHLETEQLSVFLGKNFVVTFQELPGDCLDPVRERLRASCGRIRACGPDYLAYSILDAVIDDFFPVLERYGERLDVLEEEVLTEPDLGCISRIHSLKNELILLRRAIWPQREALNTLIRDPSDLVHDETRLYLRDCYDHTVQIIDLVEVYREVGSGLTDLYVSSVSNRMNEVMKVLTVIATIFIPLSFVAGIYGMNFDPNVSPWNLPEVKWYYGYPMVLVVMALITVAMLYFFRRQGWLRSFLPPGRRRRGRPADRGIQRPTPPRPAG